MTVNKKQSETELTAGVLKKDLKHLKVNKTKQNRQHFRQTRTPGDATQKSAKEKKNLPTDKTGNPSLSDDVDSAYTE